ncbi:MAG TPA: helix-turn-helix domain-containing protein [Gaiellaceae bacterium]|nr:helix-turn-helix domain-containing protein [Gaiellaceae bacterium]
MQGFSASVVVCGVTFGVQEDGKFLNVHVVGDDLWNFEPIETALPKLEAILNAARLAQEVRHGSGRDSMKITVEINEDDLMQLLTRAACDGAALALKQRGESGGWITVDLAAEHLSTTPKAIRALVRRREIPFHRRGTRILFSRAELDSWIGETVGDVSPKN